MAKQQQLANKYHTCTCPDALVAFNWMTTKIVDVDFEHSHKECPDGRILWVVSTCLKCKGKILHGKSFCSYHVTGDTLRVSAITSANQWIGNNRNFCKKVEMHFSSCVAINQIWKKYHPKIDQQVAESVL
jgi:hypothetical protein